MKKSDELRKQAESEENDLKALGIYTKVLREERKERFDKYITKLQQAGYNLTVFESQGKFTIETSKFGTIDYYPKANKILFRKDNKWKKAGLNWIIKNLLPPESE